MTTLTITIPDNITQEIASYIEQKGGKIVSSVSARANKSAQKASLKKGLTEDMQIKKGELKSIPLSELWNE